MKQFNSTWKRYTCLTGSWKKSMLVSYLNFYASYIHKVSNDKRCPKEILVVWPNLFIWWCSRPKCLFFVIFNNIFITHFCILPISTKKLIWNLCLDVWCTSFLVDALRKMDKNLRFVQKHEHSHRHLGEGGRMSESQNSAIIVLPLFMLNFYFIFFTLLGDGSESPSRLTVSI